MKAWSRGPLALHLSRFGLVVACGIACACDKGHTGPATARDAAGLADAAPNVRDASRTSLDGSLDAPSDAAAPAAFDAGISVCEGEPAVPAWLGFPVNFTPPAGLARGHVQQVTADQLVIQPESGASVVFSWKGPALTAEFSANDTIQYGSVGGAPGGWDVVASARTTLAVGFGSSNTSVPRAGQVPGGPDYVLEAQCAFVRQGRCSDSHVIVTTLFGLRATLAQDSVLIPSGATGSVGAWQLTNVWNDEVASKRIGTPRFASCHVDPMDYAAVTALGPGSDATEPDAGH